MALGASSGSIEMNVSANSVSSSPLEMLGAHLKAAPDSRYIRKESVPLRRLDEEATPYLKGSSSSFLKIDAQGFDLEVLEGAKVGYLGVGSAARTEKGQEDHRGARRPAPPPA